MLKAEYVEPSAVRLALLHQPTCVLRRTRSVMANPRTCRHNVVVVYMYKRGTKYVECASCDTPMTQKLLNEKVFTADYKTGFWVRNRPMEDFRKKRRKFRQDKLLKG